MSAQTKCTCEWCQKFSPLCEKILFLLDNENEKQLFDKMISNLMHAETDAVYWKEKYYGRWPSDGIDEKETYGTLNHTKLQKHLNGVDSQFKDFKVIDRKKYDKLTERPQQ